MNSHPLHIVMTPVRNEAWILRAFLKATSIWADYIIVSDQMSQDGSREIYKEFPKVRVIDNTNPEMHMAATRRLLFEEANKIPGDKILFTLDADEFLCGDFLNSKDWQTIINSEVGDVFDWRWMNLLPGCKKYTTHMPYYWAAHVGDKIFDGMFPDNFIHEWRLPWPKDCKHEYILDNLFSLHFARTNVARQKNKERFYQVSTQTKRINTHGIGMYLMYHEKERKQEEFMVPDDAYITYEQNGIDLLSEIHLDDIGQYYIDESVRMIRENGIKPYRKLDIWSEDICKALDIQNPQIWMDKVMYAYLKFISPYRNSILVRAINKILKKLY